MKCKRSKTLCGCCFFSNQKIRVYWPLSDTLIVLNNVQLLRHVQTVQELTDILVLDRRRVLDVGGRLGHGFEVVTFEDQLVLLLGRIDDGHTGCHMYLADVLLAEEVTDLDDGVVLGGDAIDGEMGIYGAHLVQEALGDT